LERRIRRQTHSVGGLAVETWASKRRPLRPPLPATPPHGRGADRGGTLWGTRRSDDRPGVRPRSKLIRRLRPLRTRYAVREPSEGRALVSKDRRPGRASARLGFVDSSVAQPLRPRHFALGKESAQ